MAQQIQNLQQQNQALQKAQVDARPTDQPRSLNLWERALPHEKNIKKSSRAEVRALVAKGKRKRRRRG
jgi:hypothetical protein